MKLEEFKKQFKQLKEKGFVKSRRKGPTGVGHTLEVEIGLKENNLDLPDIDDYELKGHRINSSSMITLFTFNRKAWQMKAIQAVRKYGSFDKDGRKGLYYTMSLRPNSAGVFLYVDDTDMSIRHVSGEVIAKWNLELVAKQFKKKMPALLFVSAFSEERDGIEYFHYQRAQLMVGISPELIAEQIRSENILIDLRLHDKGTEGARNHGTGFRVKEDKLPLLFKNITDL
jgi:hypothetical protein